MSNVIDQKVVEMRFDNANFEKNVKTSLDSLDNLNSKLQFTEELTTDGSKKSTKELNKQAKKADLSPLEKSIDKVSLKFSAMQIAATTAIATITNRMMYMAKNMISSLSIDQITAGWSKYESEVSSVQTIMAATGKSIEEVSGHLEKLLWFTDETSYSFTDMASNIGKFTSNGVELDKAVEAMQGIATWAALSGANAEQASRAMYNMSQAMGTGKVLTRDWMSIENANMATTEFKQTVIDTAVAMGKLKKKSDGTYRTKKGNKKVTVETFRDSLGSGWFDSELLTAALTKYGGFSVALSNAMSKLNDSGVYMSTSEFMQIIEEYDSSQNPLEQFAESLGNTSMNAEELKEILDDLSNDTLYKLGKKAFKAAQEAKTFTEAINATKDAVSSTWMRTYELIFGNYEEAKKFWTNVANYLYEIFVEGRNATNEAIAQWSESGGRNSLITGLYNILEIVIKIKNTVKNAFARVFNTETDALAGTLTKMADSFNAWTDKLLHNEKTYETIADVIRIIASSLSLAKDSVVGIFRAVKANLPDFSKVFGLAGKGINGIANAIEKTALNVKKNKTIEMFFRSLIVRIKDTVRSIKESLSTALLSIGIDVESKWNNLKAFFENNTISDIFYKALNKIRTWFTTMSEPIVKFFSKIRTGEISITEGLKNLWKTIKERFEGSSAVNFFSGVFETVKNQFLIFKDWLTKKLNGLWETITQKLSEIPGKIKSIFKEKNPEWTEFFQRLGERFVKFRDWLLGIFRSEDLIDPDSIDDELAKVEDRALNVKGSPTLSKQILLEMKEISTRLGTDNELEGDMERYEELSKEYRELNKDNVEEAEKSGGIGQKIGNIISRAIDSIRESLEKLAGNKSIRSFFDAISPVLSIVRDIIKALADVIVALLERVSELIRTSDNNTLLLFFSIIEKFLMAIATFTIAKSVKNFSKSFEELSKSLSGIFASISSSIKKLGDTFSKVLKNGQSASINDITKFLLSLVGLFAVLAIIASTVNSDDFMKVTIVLGTFVIVMAVLSSIMAKLSKTTFSLKNWKGTAHVNELAKTILSIGVVLIALTLVFSVLRKFIEKIAFIRKEQGAEAVNAGLEAFGTIMMAILAFMLITSIVGEYTKNTKHLASLAAMCAGIYLVALVAIKLGTIDSEVFGNGLLNVGMLSALVLGILFILQFVGGQSKNTAKGMFGLYSVIIAVGILSLIAIELSKIGVTLGGVGAVAAMVVAIIALMVTLSAVSNSLKATTIVALAFAFLALAAAIFAIGFAITAMKDAPTEIVWALAAMIAIMVLTVGIIMAVVSALGAVPGIGEIVTVVVVAIAVAFFGVATAIFAIGIAVSLIVGAITNLIQVLDECHDVLNQGGNVLGLLAGIAGGLLLIDIALAGLGVVLVTLGVGLTVFSVGALAFVGVMFLGAIAVGNMGNALKILGGGIDAVANGLRNFKNLIKEIIDDITKGIKEVVDTVKGIGEDVWSTIQNFFTGLGDGIMKTFNKVFGISSPSKEFYKTAHFCVEGFTNGLDDGTKDIDSSMSNLGDGALSSFTDALGLDNISNPEDILGSLTDGIFNVDNLDIGGENGFLADLTNTMFDTTNLDSTDNKNNLLEYVSGILGDIEDDDGNVLPIELVADTTDFDNSMNGIMSKYGNLITIPGASGLDLAGMYRSANQVSQVADPRFKPAEEIIGPVWQPPNTSYSYGAATGGDVYNIDNTFNVNGFRAKELAQEVAKYLQESYERKVAVWDQ